MDLSFRVRKRSAGPRMRGADDGFDGLEGRGRIPFRRAAGFLDRVAWVEVEATSSRKDSHSSLFLVSVGGLVGPLVWVWS